ncbi:hypothetical protein KJ865_07790, partial [Myxococcota bacterium]|nr:hypothetical protein [Myxococcota bacterium]
MKNIIFTVLFGLIALMPGLSRAQNLVVDATTIEMSGLHWYDSITVINGGIIMVTPYDNGSDKENFGNLQLVAASIYIDSTSAIVATGAGYQPGLCLDGAGPYADSGGRGGCSVRDSGGGGAHFGGGGRGTKDCPSTGCIFPGDWEESCGSYPGTGTTCDTVAGCSNDDGLPTVAGQPYSHSIWEVEFGAAGGDAGCRDSDGFSNPICVVGGAGGGRIVLAA